MAEFTINVIPQDLNVSLTTDQITNGKTLFKSFFPNVPYEVDVRVSDQPFFVTARDAFDSIECPECGETIERFGDNEDHEEWWEECLLVKTDYSDAPVLDEELSMPCCGESVKLGDIDFGASARLVKFAISLQDPDDASSLTSVQLTALEVMLGCHLIQITSVRT